MKKRPRISQTSCLSKSAVLMRMRLPRFMAVKRFSLFCSLANIRSSNLFERTSPQTGEDLLSRIRKRL